MDPYSYYMPTMIRFGAGVFAEAPGVLAGPACGLLVPPQPLVVTGAGSARAMGLIDRMENDLPDAVIFDGVEENPTTEVCDRIAAAARDAGVNVILAIGGGSPMDAAKAAAILATNSGDTADYFGRDTWQRPPLPLVAVPTTAGSGSEVTPYAVLVDAESGKKATIGGRDLFPRVALLDPELTRGLPRAITVNTGLDVLSQAMEGMLSRKATPVSDAIALEACRVVREALPKVADDGADLESRGRMLHAATLAGMVIAQTGTTLVHGMGYYYTLEAGVAHGRANALLLTPVFQFNARHAPAKVAAIAAALGHSCDPEPDPAAEAIGAAVHELLHALGVSPAARDAGVREDDLERFAADIAEDPYRFRNQPGAIDEGTLRAFYEQSWAGER